MKIVSISDGFILITPKNLYLEEKDKMIRELKNFLLTYNNYFSFLKTGFYEVSVGYNELIGTIFIIKKEEDFIFGEDHIDLRITIMNEVDIGFSFEDDIIPLDKVYFYQDKYYLFDNKLIKKYFYTLIEQGEYVFSNKIIENRSRDIKYVNDISVGTAVQASCSYPGIFSPCRFNDDLLVDGGIAENLPWRESKKSGADKVVSIVFVDKDKKKCDNIYEVLNKSFSILCSELANYEWDGTDYLLKLYMPKVGLLAKERQKELYELGYKQTKDKISDIVRSLKN